MIDQGDVEFVAPGQRVEIMLTQSAEYVYVSKIERVSTEDLKVAPDAPLEPARRPLADADERQRRAAAAQPRLRSGRAAAEEDRTACCGSAWWAAPKSRTAPRTLFDRLYRYVARTFNFEL